MRMETLLAILSSLFASTTILQFFNTKGLKKKLSAQASQEAAKSEALNLENMNTLLSMQGKELISLAAKNEILTKINEELTEKAKGYDSAIQELRDQVDELKEILQNTLDRAEYAEGKLCINDSCKLRRPKLGSFKPID